MGELICVLLYVALGSRLCNEHFLCITSLIQRRKSLGEWLVPSQQERSSSKTMLLFLSSQTGCHLCRCEGTNHKSSHLQTPIHSHFSQPLYLASPGPRKASCHSPSSPCSSGGHCHFTSALFTNVQSRPQLSSSWYQGDTTYSHLFLQVPESGELSTTLNYSLCQSCYLLTQPGLSQNCFFPNSSSSLHNSAYDCSCPKVLAVFLTDHNHDYPFLLIVKPLRLTFYSLVLPPICILPFENPMWGFSTLDPPCHHQHVTWHTE